MEAFQKAERYPKTNKQAPRNRCKDHRSVKDKFENGSCFHNAPFPHATKSNTGVAESDICKTAGEMKTEGKQNTSLSHPKMFHYHIRHLLHVTAPHLRVVRSRYNNIYLNTWWQKTILKLDLTPSAFSTQRRANHGIICLA